MTDIQKELKRITDENNGILLPERVVEEAKVETSPLHDSFNWDNTDAAQKYRVHQARNLIRCTVVYEERTEKYIKTFVSLSSDRDNGGGYREVIIVLKDTDKKAEMLADALSELQAFQNKYNSLVELCEVFDAIRQLETIV